MNFAIISGYLSDQIDQKTLPDGQKVVDGCLLKPYTNRDTGEVFSKKYFFTITGRLVNKFLQEYAPDDKVVIQGTMSAGSDEVQNGYYTRIMVKSICRLAEDAED